MAVRLSLLGRLFLLQAFMAAGVSFGWSLVWLYWWRAGIPLSVLALFHGLAFGMVALALVFARPLPTRPSVGAGVLVRALSFLLAAAIASPLGLLGLAPLLGVGLMLFWVPFNAAYFSRVSRDHLALSAGFLFLVWPVLSAVLPALAGSVARAWGFLPVFAAAALFVGLGLGLVRGLPGDRVPVEPRAALRLRARWLLLLEGLWQGTVWIAVPLATLSFESRPAEYGSILSLFGLAGAAASLLLAGLSDRWHRRRGFLLVLSPLLAAAALLTGTSGGLLGWEAGNTAIAFLSILLGPFATAVVLESSPGPVPAMVARELWLNIGRLAGGLAVAGLALTGAPLTWAVAGAGLLFVLYPLEVVRGRFYREPSSPAPGALPVPGRP